jgi:site-specific DNA-cytosine methylase
MTHASIVPLIGGETIAQQNVFGTRPEYILSFSPFKNNDSHLLNYYNHEVPYHVIDEGAKVPHRVDVINTVCPCAGLSALSPTASGSSAMNEWMFRSAEYVLGNIKPRVFWGENAPRLASKLGEPVVDRLRKIGKENGYTFSIFKTKSKVHGLSQVRERTFYFFWQGTKIPLLEYCNHSSNERIEDTIEMARRAAKNDPMSQILTSKKVPSQDPYYRYLLEEVHGGISHRKFAESLTRTANVLRSIEGAPGHDYMRVAAWMEKNGFSKLAERSKGMHLKLGMGGNIMRKQIEVPCDVIGAFVGHMPTMLTHHRHDRFLNVRECLSIMKMPLDFQLLNPSRNLNHICQNVPVTTAEHPARMVKMFLEDKLPLDDYADGFLIQDNVRQCVTSGEAASLETFMA